MRHLLSQRFDLQFLKMHHRSIIVSQINFTITRAGLAGQILATTLQHEKPELEIRNMELMKKGESYKVQIADLEETLLQELAAAEGNILENKSFVLVCC